MFSILSSILSYLASALLFLSLLHRSLKETKRRTGRPSKIAFMRPNNLKPQPIPSAGGLSKLSLENERRREEEAEQRATRKSQLFGNTSPSTRKRSSILGRLEKQEE